MFKLKVKRIGVGFKTYKYDYGSRAAWKAIAKRTSQKKNVEWVDFEFMYGGTMAVNTFERGYLIYSTEDY